MNQEKRASRDRRAELFAGVAVAVMTLLVYSPCFHYPFVDYDDPSYVLKNPHVRSGLSADNLRWAFTTFACSNWHPLTWLSLQLDAEFHGGQNAGAFHRTNVLLHTANALLLLLVLARMTGETARSAFVAALFALHPLHVESVAWVTERKDVLSTFFLLLTLAAYLFYVKRPSVRRYLPLLLALTLGLLAKPMLVTLPCVLLLLDYWPLRRWPFRGFRSLLLEKAPLFALVLPCCLVTFQAHLHGEDVMTLEHVSLAARLGNTLLAYVGYLGKMLWPVNLAIYYPHPGPRLSATSIVSAGLLLAGITALVFGPGRRRPYLAVGWLWYLGTLVPVIGLVQVGSQGMADRYTYVPLIGIFLMLSWGAADLAKAWHLRRAYLAAAATLVLTVCAALTWNQIGSWQSNRHLWEHAIAATDNNALAHLKVGVDYGREGKIGEAKRALEQAIAIDPNMTGPHANLGNVYGILGLWERAAAEHRTAVALSPSSAGSHYNLGNTLAQLGQRQEAMAEYRRAIDLEPNDAWAHLKLGIQLSQLGRLEEAESHFRTAVKLVPANAEVHSNLSILLAELGRHEEARAEARRAIALDSKDSRFHNQLAGLLQEEGQLDEALAEYHSALELGDRQVRPRLEACQQLRALRPRLAALIAGRDRPADDRERLAFAVLCGQRQQRRYSLAARLYAEAFRTEPQLTDDPRDAVRFEAAAASAAAGCGRDAGSLDEQERARLRRQALRWLQADLGSWTRLVQSGRPDDRVAAGRMLRRWQRDDHFSCVRDPALLAQLQESERQAWRKLWDEVAATLVQANSPPPEQGSDRIHE